MAYPDSWLLEPVNFPGHTITSSARDTWFCNELGKKQMHDLFCYANISVCMHYHVRTYDTYVLKYAYVIGLEKPDFKAL